MRNGDDWDWPISYEQLMERLEESELRRHGVFRNLLGFELPIRRPDSDIQVPVQKCHKEDLINRDVKGDGAVHAPRLSKTEDV